MHRDRITITLIIALILVIAVGLARPKVPGVPAGMQEAVLSLTKTTWPAKFDMVLAGDSRVTYSLSPEKMNETLPGFRIANFGFPVCGFEKNYLDSTENLLEPKSDIKTIVLGITPRSLTPDATQNNGYLEQKKSDPFAKFVFKILHRPSVFLLSYTTLEIKTLIERRPPPASYYSEIKPDGWIASNSIPEKANGTISQYAGRPFEGDNKVSPEIVAALANRVTKWRHEGIKVYAFRPPVSSERISLENKMGGYNEKEISHKLRAAGAVWLDFNPDAYQTCDGSHLTKKSALEFSKDLAGKILKTL